MVDKHSTRLTKRTQPTREATHWPAVIKAESPHLFTDPCTPPVLSKKDSHEGQDGDAAVYCQRLAVLSSRSIQPHLLQKCITVHTAQNVVQAHYICRLVETHHNCACITTNPCTHYHSAHTTAPTTRAHRCTHTHTHIQHRTCKQQTCVWAHYGCACHHPNPIQTHTHSATANTEKNLDQGPWVNVNPEFTVH